MNQKHSWRLSVTFLLGVLMVALAVYLQIPDSARASISCQGLKYWFDGTNSPTVQHYGSGAATGSPLYTVKYIRSTGLL